MQSYCRNKLKLANYLLKKDRQFGSPLQNDRTQKQKIERKLETTFGFGMSRGFPETKCISENYTRNKITHQTVYK